MTSIFMNNQCFGKLISEKQRVDFKGFLVSIKELKAKIHFQISMSLKGKSLQWIKKNKREKTHGGTGQARNNPEELTV